MERTLYKNFKINLPACWGFLKDHSVDYDYHKKRYKYGFFQPPTHFLKASGLDISGKYNLGGLKKEDIQVLCYASYHSKKLGNLANLLRDLAELNPELKRLNSYLDIPEDLYHILMGISSLFNVDDIIFFVYDYQGKMLYNDYVNQNTPIKKMLNLLSIMNPSKNWYSEIQWVMSPKTIDVVIKKVIDILEDR